MLFIEAGSAMRDTIFILQAVWVTIGFVTAGFPSPAPLQQKDQAQTLCSVASKNQYYQDFLESFEGVKRDRAKALEVAKRYLACPSDPDDPEEKLAQLNLAVGRMLSLSNSPSEAIPYFIKAASYASTVETSPQTYADLAAAYEQVYEKLATAYQTRGPEEDVSDKSRLELENINQIVDRIIDALARAVALAGPDIPKPTRGVAYELKITNPTTWLLRLTELYKYRHHASEVGLRDLIRSVLSTPLPPEPTPITSLPPLMK
jgi:hypothetical protein